MMSILILILAVLALVFAILACFQVNSPVPLLPLSVILLSAIAIAWSVGAVH